MIVIRIKGGLGNQLFEYAAGYSLAKRLNQQVLLDISFYRKNTLRSFKLHLLNINNLNFIENERLPKLIKVFNNKYLNKFMRKIKVYPINLGNYKYCFDTETKQWFFSVSNKDIYLNGYFQSQDYFINYKKELKLQFSPTHKYDFSFSNILQKINNCISVAVHFRRGDFLSKKLIYNKFHYILSENYYYNSFKFIEHRFSNPTYFIFSDNIELARKFFNKDIFNEDKQRNFIFVKLNSDINEIMLMKKCKNIITANSSYSWWAAWLNDSKNNIILCPSKNYGIEIPKNWIKIND